MLRDLLPIFEKHGYILVGNIEYAPGRWEIRIAPKPEGDYPSFVFDYDKIAAEIEAEEQERANE
jgi:hypothetical protein